MKKDEEKIILKKKAELQCRLGYINEEISRQKERITLSEKEKKNRENYLITLEKELEEIKSEIPNFSEDTYKQYKRYFEAEEKINKIMINKDVEIGYIKERLKQFLCEKEAIIAELAKIDDEIVHTEKAEINK